MKKRYSSSKACGNLLLSAAGLVALITLVVSGTALAVPKRIQSQAQTQPANASNPKLASFVCDVVSIKLSHPVAGRGAGRGRAGVGRGGQPPDGLVYSSFTLRRLILQAYGIQDFLISGAPNLFDSDAYNIDAKMDSSV